MKTIVLKVSEPSASSEDILYAASLIKEGKLVAFPTETVYGLGADAMNKEAVKKIFQAKNRPSDNPLIVHISDPKQLKPIVGKIPKSAHLFMDAFWPGPLSIVLPRHKELPGEITAGFNTVVVRFPKHPIAQALIKAAGTPIAAPSANLSGKVSPTRAEHVLQDLNGRIPLILDGGEIEYGLESTVVDCTSKNPIVLRPGSITIEMLKKIVPKTTDNKTLSEPKSPGMKYKHYAPDVPITLFNGNPLDTTKAMEEYITKSNPEKLVVLWYAGDFSNLPHNYRMPANTYEAAPELFHTLRTADLPSAERILIQGYDTEGVGMAIMNRLEKAASEVIQVPT
ncbi:threonylcarbamoyl-AMP synthase [Candidatus Nomurabacteria bacterium]|nr:threonylcarbamoyl-AMP synthase [Candidatus Nomurabacteria bacterium]MCB9818535.1 threonylcarbamoyl-AMP synthase [Candidatus Nomurabacteria bacterium]